MVRTSRCTRPVDPVHLPPFCLCGEPLLVEFLRCSLAEGLVRPDRVVDGLPGSQLLAQLADGIRQVDHLVELLLVRALRALHMAVQLGGAGRQDEERECAFLAGPLEVSLEL